VFLTPTHRDNYSWHTLDGETEEPVWLEVDLRGLTLHADFWELHELTEAAVSEAGFWWGNWAPDRERAPARLKPYLDQAGVVTYEVLLDEAAGAAIETTRSAAIFAPVEPARIKVV